MRTLLVDNHDSYTYNVFHLLAAASGEEPVVVNNDAVSWRVLSRSDFDAIVLSPGPGRPERWHDFGVCRDILRYSEIPVLGICLGHQGIGNLMRGQVERAPVAMHGRLSRVRHDGSGLFEGIPQDFTVVRYHSLAITSPMGPEGYETAWSSDGVVMGIQHRTRPMWGVQFHPESVATEHGLAIAENFFRLAGRHRRDRHKLPLVRRPAAAGGGGAERPAGAADGSTPAADTSPAAGPTPAGARRSRPAGPRLLARTLKGEAPAEHLYERLFAAAERSFWLDSADAPTWLAQCSYLGTSAGPDRCFVEYDVDAGELRVSRGGAETVERGSIFDFLDRELGRAALEPPAGIERGLVGGYVGYLGYECKADCGARNLHSSDLPDAAFVLANRVVAIDHVNRRTHVLAVCGAGEGEAEAERWLDEAAELAAAAISAPPRPDRKSVV